MRQTPYQIRAMPLLLWALLLACVVPECILIGADQGWWGTNRWRPDSYAYGAFWAGLLKGWLPNYPFQPYVMFISYAFLHAGFWHLLVNMVVLMALGRHTIGRIGPWKFTLFYLLCILGGGIGFAEMTNTLQPMVGASGALFGLIAANLVWHVLDNQDESTPLYKALLRPVFALLIINLGSLLIASGQVAWETHLGGTITGLALAPLFRKP
ncbi:Rhomboid family protein [Roseovarius albus]|uniref:Rhomboid family protein n=1 Tax=Roseovarius albus TaxID=1247867 RepID=A0A1X6YV70_9RHOB|nr:rhomboid family intramembrane serine protease [Roseovarius albus]SLN32398.1 Rhomboid family protein [Roseovarius albus]